MRSSIRQKIMFLLSLTSFLSSAIFLVYSINVFQKDKIAYIYDTNSVYLDTISNQFKNEIKLASELSKKFLLEYQKNKSFVADVNNPYLEEDSFVKGVYLVDVTQQPKLVDKVTTLTKLPLKITENPNFLKVLNKLKSEKQALFFTDQEVYLCDMVYEKEEQIAVVVSFTSDSLKTFFDSSKSFQTFIINDQGEVVRQMNGLENNYLNTYFSKIRSNLNLLKLGTSEILSNKKKSYLLSSTSLGYNDSYLVTLTDKDQAFGVLSYLINKSLIVFFMVLSGVILVSQFASTYITKRILELYEAAKQIINGDFKINLAVKGDDEISLLTQTFNKMSVEIVKLLDDTAQKARFEAELRTAQTVQQTLFPEVHAQFKDAEIYGSYESASECGGDWWHYHESEKSIWFWMADATGHGAPAALITSAIKSAVAMTENLSMSPTQAIDLVNKSICQVSKNKMMMTCFLGVMDKATKKLYYVNASHEAPFIMNKENPIKKKDLVFLDESKCNRLGQSSTSEFSVAEYQLKTGDRIFVYTDGVPDIRNLHEEPLQERGMFKYVIENHNKFNSVADFVQALQTQLNEYREKSELVDDVTFFAVDVL